MPIETHVCVNCHNTFEGRPHIFQGVMLCKACFRLVDHVISRAQRELKLLFLTYTDMIRVALVKGELRPPRLPSGKEMPKDALFKGLSKLREVIRADSQEVPADAGDVRPLRGGEADAVDQPQHQRRPPAVSGGRGLREVPTVQENRPPSEGDPQEGAGDTNRVEGDT